MTLSELDALWALRHVDKERGEFARHITQTESESPGDVEILWRQARRFHFDGMLGEGSGDEKRTAALYGQGHAVAGWALDKDHENPRALFWAATCHLEWARKRGRFAAIRALARARRQLEAAAERDSSFHYAGPLRVLGRMAQATPRWLGGDIDEAIALYRQALKLAPAHPTTMMYLAESLWDKSQHKEARNVLDEIVAAPPFPDWIWEQERDRGRARMLLEALPR